LEGIRPQTWPARLPLIQFPRDLPAHDKKTGSWRPKPVLTCYNFPPTIKKNLKQVLQRFKIEPCDAMDAVCTLAPHLWEIYSTLQFTNKSSVLWNKTRFMKLDHFSITKAFHTPPHYETSNDDIYNVARPMGQKS